MPQASSVAVVGQLGEGAEAIAALMPVAFQLPLAQSSTRLLPPQSQSPGVFKHDVAPAPLLATGVNVPTHCPRHRRCRCRWRLARSLEAVHRPIRRHVRRSDLHRGRPHMPRRQAGRRCRCRRPKCSHNHTRRCRRDRCSHSVKRTDARVHVVADAVAIGVSSASAATHAQGVEHTRNRSHRPGCSHNRTRRCRRDRCRCRRRPSVPPHALYVVQRLPSCRGLLTQEPQARPRRRRRCPPRGSSAFSVGMFAQPHS